MTTIRQWQDKIKSIYPNTNITIDYMMAHTYTKCGDLSAAINPAYRHINTESIVIGAITWMISLCNHLEIDYQDALISRFPGVCPYCNRAPCNCDTTNKTAVDSQGYTLSASVLAEALMNKYEAFRYDTHDFTLESFLDISSKIYPVNKSLLKRGAHDYVARKLLEEGGEIHRAYSAFLQGKGQKSHIGVEIADLSCWVFSCWDLNGKRMKLNSEFASTYSSGCPKCKQPTCKCPTYSITRGQEELIRAIADKLREVQEKGIKGREIDEAINLAKEVETRGGKAAAKSFMSRVKDALTIIKGASDGSEELKNIADNLRNVSDDLGNMFN